MTLDRPPAKGRTPRAQKLLAAVGVVTVLLKDHLAAIGRRKLGEIVRLVSMVGETSKFFSRRFSL
jgi:hypothetical protein